MKKQVISVNGSDLIQTIRDILSSGIARRIVVRNGTKAILDLPLGFIGVGMLLSPLLAGLSVALVLIRQYEVEIYKA